MTDQRRLPSTDDMRLYAGNSFNPLRPFAAPFLRGLRCRCPACGIGPLFPSDLKLAPTCTGCGEKLHHARPDDAPACFVMLTTGYFIILIALALEEAFAPTLWSTACMLSVAAAAVAITLLLPMTGAIVPIQWTDWMSTMKSKLGIAAFSLIACTIVGDGGVSRAGGAKDPGVRGGAAAAGGPIAGLTSDELGFFNAGQTNFQQAEGVGDGLGPRFNLDSCSGCHAQPAVGGSSPVVNPQPTVGLAYGARNAIPSFVRADGPVVEARFKRFANGSPDGQVHSLFVISGRVDATGNAGDCIAVQENFEAQLLNGNVSLRIPTPLFGAGLIEAIDDATILANLASNASFKAQLGIAGHPNRSANTGTITRFGWKAQNPSILVFAGEAYAVEMGISNEAFPIERDNNPTCQYAPTPNDSTVVDGFKGLPATQTVSDLERFSFFMKFLAPPIPSTNAPGGFASIARGRQTFNNVGCALCHTPTLQTPRSNTVPALSSISVSLFSDLALHKMGSRLADGISQGAAAGDEFRTAPLWGLGQRIFFLHDGRTSDLTEAIDQHASGGSTVHAPSEANQVIRRFDALRDSSKQDLLNFLRSL